MIFGSYITRTASNYNLIVIGRENEIIWFIYCFAFAIEKDILAFSGCTYGLNVSEANELTSIR